MTRPIVFVSHATTDGRVARSLKSAVEEAFGGGLEVFVASDPTFDGINEGWLDVIHAQIDRSILMVVVRSRLSTDRPWVNFEIGAAWMRRIPVVCLAIDPGDASVARAPIDQFRRVTFEALATVLIAEADANQAGHPAVDAPSVDALTCTIREAVERSL